MPIIPEYTSDVKPTAETPNVLANVGAMTGGLARGIGALSQGLEQAAEGFQKLEEKQRDLDLVAIQTDAGNSLLDESTKISQLRGNLAHYKVGPNGEDLSLADAERLQLPELKKEIMGRHKLDPIAQQEFDKWWNLSAAPHYLNHVASQQARETRQYAVDQIDAKTELAKKLVHQNPALLPSLIADLKETIKKVYPGSNSEELAATKIAQIEDQAKASQEGRNVTIAVQNIERRFMKDPKYEGDKVAALDAAGEYLTSPPPEGQDDLEELKGLSPTERERVIKEVDSSYTHAKRVYDLKSNKQAEELTQEIEARKYTANEMIGKIDATDLNKSDKAKLRTHLDHQERQDKQDAKAEASRIKSEKTAERTAAAAERAAANAHRQVQLEERKAEKDKAISKVLHDFASDNPTIKTHLDLIRAGVPPDALPVLNAELNAINSDRKANGDAQARKNAIKTIKDYAATQESDKIKQDQLTSSVYAEYAERAKGKTDPAELNKIVDGLVKEKSTHRLKDILEGVGNFFKPKGDKVSDKKLSDLITETPAPHKTIVKTGTYKGKKVVQYSDGTTEYDR